MISSWNHIKLFSSFYRARRTVAAWRSGTCWSPPAKLTYVGLL